MGAEAFTFLLGRCPPCTPRLRPPTSTQNNPPGASLSLEHWGRYDLGSLKLGALRLCLTL